MEKKKKKKRATKKTIKKKDYKRTIINAILSIILCGVIIINIIGIGDSNKHNNREKQVFQPSDISKPIKEFTNIVKNNTQLLKEQIEEEQKRLEEEKQLEEQRRLEEEQKKQEEEQRQEQEKNNNTKYNKNNNTSSNDKQVINNNNSGNNNNNNNYQQPVSNGTQTYYQDSARQVLDLINQARAENGLQPLSWNSSIEAAAKTRAPEIVNTFEHIRPNGQSWSTALNIGYSTAGENIAAGQPNAQTVVNSWLNSPGHRANIMNADFNQMGVALYYDSNSEYKYHWVQIFTN